MQQPAIFRTNTPSICEIAHVDEHIAMRVHRSLRLSGGTRGIEQQRQTVWFRGMHAQIVVGKSDIRMHEIDNVEKVVAADLSHGGDVV